MKSNNSGGARPRSRRIILDDLRTQASIGVLEHERLQPQILHMHAWLDCRAETAVDDNNLASVLDYRQLRELLLQEASKGHVNLLETLVERCLRRIMQEFPDVWQARLRICKPAAFDDCAAVCIEESRVRPEDQA